MVPTVFVINGLTKHDWSEVLLFLPVAVAVGLTPEMLPMIVTVVIPAKGAIAHVRKKVIVKRLNSIQNFGAMDVLVHRQDRHFDERSHYFEAATRHLWQKSQTAFSNTRILTAIFSRASRTCSMWRFSSTTN